MAKHDYNAHSTQTKPVESPPNGNQASDWHAESPSLQSSLIGLRELVETLPQLVWTCLPNGECDYLSPQWVNYTGIPEASQLGSAWMAQVHPDDIPRIIEARNRSVATGDIYDVEFRIRRHDGIYRWFKTRAVPMRDQQGKILKWFGTNTDIEDQKQTEAALWLEKERFTKLTAAFPGVVCTFRRSPDGAYSFRYASAGAFTIYGVAPEALLQDSLVVFSRIHPEDASRVYATIEDSAQTLQPWYCEWRQFHPTRGLLWLEGHSMPVREPDGSLIWHGLVTEITQRKLSESAAARLVSIVESSEDAIIGKDLEGIVTNWNRGAEKIFGYTAAEMIGQSLAKIIPPDRQDEEEMILNRIRRGQTIQHFDTKRLHKDGHLLDISISVSAIKDATGKVIGASKVARDVTERNKAEHALRLSEEHLRLATEAALMGTWERDFKSNKLFWSAKMEQLMGFAPGTFPGTLDAFTPLIHPDSRETFEAARLALQDDKSGTYRAELCFKLPDGRERWGLVSGQVINDENGQPSRLVGVDWDITERKRAEEAISQSQAQLEAVFQSIQDGIVVTDMSGKFLLVNEAEAKICGYATAEEMKKNLEYFVGVFELTDADGTIIPMSDWPLSRILRGESLRDQEVRGKRLDTGQEWYFSYSGVPVFDKQGKQVLAVVVTSDITARKLAEEKVSKLNEELEQRVLERTTQLAAANKELEAFSYSVSHDLRAPLRHINGFSQALLEDYADQLDEVGKSYLQELRSASSDMAHLIDDVLQLARVTRQEMHKDNINLSELASSAVAALKKRHPERVVNVSIAPNLMVRGDKRLLEIMTMNLLDNAWKFTSKNDQAYIEFGQEMQAGRLVYFVRDNGAGFDMAYAGKLFGAFQRLHSANEFEGTGVGLATVQRVITRHGGSVWCQAAVNEGATFFFTLP